VNPTGCRPGTLPASDDGKALIDARKAPELEVPDAPALGALVGRMLEKNPVKRPRDGAEVLARLLEIGAALARVPGVAVRPVKARRRPAWRLPALVAAGVVLGGLAAAAGLRLADRPAAEVAPEGRLVVAVADVANRTGDAELDGLSGLLIASLEQSRRFGVLTRARMSDLARQAGRADAARIDEVLGREICRRGLAKALIVAAVHRIGSVYSLELRALDPTQDAYLFTLHERADTKEGLLAAIDRISLEARRALREPGAEVEAARRTVASLVTGNLDAFRHYASAQRHLDGVRYAEAVLELRTALGLDPEFALAHYLLARLGRRRDRRRGAGPPRPGGAAAEGPPAREGAAAPAGLDGAARGPGGRGRGGLPGAGRRLPGRQGGGLRAREGAARPGRRRGGGALPHPGGRARPDQRGGGGRAPGDPGLAREDGGAAGDRPPGPSGGPWPPDRRAGGRGHDLGRPVRRGGPARHRGPGAG
jgi:hypothetical protein